MTNIVIDTPLYQWDKGRKITITLTKPQVQEVHFARKGENKALPVKPYKNGSKLIADIPDVLLQKATKLNVYLVVGTEDKQYTIYDRALTIIEREKPEDYVYTEEEKMIWADLDERITKLEEDDGGAITVDPTLTQEGMAADAAAVGKAIDAIPQVFRRMSEIAGPNQYNNILSIDLEQFVEWGNGSYHFYNDCEETIVLFKLGDKQTMQTSVTTFSIVVQFNASLNGDYSVKALFRERSLYFQRIGAEFSLFTYDFVTQQELNNNAYGFAKQDYVDNALATTVKSVNGIKPDTNGNVEIATSSTGNPLIGTTEEITPTQVAEAVAEGRPVFLTHDDHTSGRLGFNNFIVYETELVVIASAVLEYNNSVLAAELLGSLQANKWVTVVNEVLTEAPVTSVNGKTGDVQLTADDVGAIPADMLEAFFNLVPPTFPVLVVRFPENYRLFTNYNTGTSDLEEIDLGFINKRRQEGLNPRFIMGVADDENAEGRILSTRDGTVTPNVNDPKDWLEIVVDFYKNEKRVILRVIADGIEEIPDPSVGIPLPPTAEVGQYFKVSAVDENGNVTAVEAVDAPSGGGGMKLLVDYTTAEEVWNPTRNFLVFTEDVDGSQLFAKNVLIFLGGTVINGTDTDSHIRVRVNDAWIQAPCTPLNAPTAMYCMFNLDNSGRLKAFYLNSSEKVTVADVGDAGSAITLIQIQGNNYNKTHLAAGATVKVWGW